MSLELVLFLATAGLAVFFAIGMLLSEKAVHSALFLIGNLGCVALLFLMMDAPFLGMVQVAVYAGAIMVLFLFVIMLLGAEQTTDTTRRYRWMAGAATVLGVGLLISLALPIVISGVELPEYEGDAPMLRVVHAANTVGIEAVDVTVSGGEEDVTVSDVMFADVTDFMTLEPGDYTVTITPAGVASPLLQQDVTLNRNEAFTAVAYGTFDLELGLEGQTLALALMPNDLSYVEGDTARVTAFNGFVDAPVALVDLGPDGVLTLGQRDVTNDEGETETSTAIFDPIYIEDVQFGEISEPVSMPERAYDLALVQTDNLDTSNPSNNILVRLEDYTPREGTEQPIVLAGEPPALEGDPLRPRVLDRDQSELTIVAGASFGSPRSIGQILFTDYLLPVNLVGFLLLVAMIGAIILTRPAGIKIDRRVVQRRKVSRPLVSVIMQQTGSDVAEDTPRLDSPASGD